jgi:ABC-type glycerol-3-phosphate transport system permease component
MGMEDETREFLVRILNTIAMVLLWMITGVFFGIFLGYAFFDGSPTWKNYVFYIAFLISFYFLIKYLVRKWKDKMN